MSDRSKNDDAQWRNKLSPEEFHICRENGTERPFTGAFWDHKARGQYTCKCCKKPLFSSSSKYDSGSGWPSFYQPLSSGEILEQQDTSQGMIRTEIKCQNCGSHLGHLFPDGPEPTGLRYCVNSASLGFVEEQQ